MPAKSHQPESSLDLLLAGASGNTQYFVIANSHNPTLEKQSTMEPDAKTRFGLFRGSSPVRRLAPSLT
jgi:hypothetical protein